MNGLTILHQNIGNALNHILIALQNLLQVFLTIFGDVVINTGSSLTNELLFKANHVVVNQAIQQRIQRTFLDAEQTLAASSS